MAMTIRQDYKILAAEENFVAYAMLPEDYGHLAQIASILNGDNHPFALDLKLIVERMVACRKGEKI